MKRAITIFLLMALAVSGVLFAADGKQYSGSIDVTGMPDIEIEDKDVVVYSWMDYIPVKDYDWEGFRFVDYYGGSVDTVIATGDYYENLYKMISAGDIPDAAVAEATSFPALIMRGLVQPWDEYLDFSDPIWEATGALDEIEQMRWSDGHIYNITGNSHVLGVMFYNKRLVEDAGLDDPAELQAEGLWTWDEFFYYLEELTQDVDGDGVTDIYGMVNTGDFPIAVFCSTGETPIEYKDGVFYNNLKSQKQKDAADFLYQLMNSNPRVMSTGDPVATFQQGRAAFVYTNDYRGYIDYADLWQTDGLGVVPFPAYREGEPQYQAALVDYLYLMRGAQNPEGAAAMALAQRYDVLLNVNPDAVDADETTKLDFMDHGFTEEAAQMIVDINNMPHKIIWSRSITIPNGNLEYRAMVQPWTTLSDSMSGIVDSAIRTAMTPMNR